MIKWYEPELRRIAQAHGVDPQMMLAISLVESGAERNPAVAYRFEPDFWPRYLANNPKYAGTVPERVSASYGIMQVMYPTAVDHGYVGEPEGLCDVTTNLTVASKVLAGLKTWAGGAGRIEAIVAAYNGGRGVGKTGPYKGKQLAYLTKYYAALRRIGG